MFPFCTGRLSFLCDEEGVFPDLSTIVYEQALELVQPGSNDVRKKYDMVFIFKVLFDANGCFI